MKNLTILFQKIVNQTKNFDKCSVINLLIRSRSKKDYQRSTSFWAANPKPQTPNPKPQTPNPKPIQNLIKFLYKNPSDKINPFPQNSSCMPD
jgi:hypothetical protein